jgi:glycosyltransferase involved in cell wall biosynthesis
VSQRVLKDTIYRRAIEHADRVCLATPETSSILNASLPSALRERLAEKQLVLALGYDPDEFFFSIAERAEAREELGLHPDECVFVTGTRVNPKKGLERVIDSVSRLRLDGKPARYVIAGFMGDSYEAELKRYVAAQPDPRFFHCSPFLDHRRMRRLYCGADVGIWTRAAISIQESMGTGLPVLLESKRSVSHLVDPGVNGWHFHTGNLAMGMESAMDAAPSMTREAIASSN